MDQVVDYINADPDMNPRSFYANGVPDEVVRHIVWLLFFEAMKVVKKGQGFFDSELSEADAEAGWLERRKLEQAGKAASHCSCRALQFLRSSRTRT